VFQLPHNIAPIVYPVVHGIHERIAVNQELLQLLVREAEVVVIV
jgi:hypothetical protein